MVRQIRFIEGGEICQRTCEFDMGHKIKVCDFVSLITFFQKWDGNLLTESISKLKFVVRNELLELES
jgi:hypothetical protein